MNTASRCLVCNRPLSKEASRVRGMGPVCARRCAPPKPGLSPAPRSAAPAVLDGQADVLDLLEVTAG